MTIAEQTQSLAESQAAAPADDVMSAFAREQAALAGLEPVGVIAVGTTLTDAELLDPRGQATTLSAALGGRRGVLVFYRGAWCPYCNIALKAYREQLHPTLVDRDVALIAVSPQRPDGSLSMQEKNDLPFPVLSDPGNALAGELGILMPARSDDVRAAQEKLGLRLEDVNADGTETLPLPTVVLLDADNRIAWIDVHPDYTTRTEVIDILAAVDSSLQTSGA